MSHSASQQGTTPTKLRGVLVTAIAGLVAAVLLVPLGYTLWRQFGGGREQSVRQRLERLAQADPAVDATAAIQRGDLRLLVPYAGAWDNDAAEQFVGADPQRQIRRIELIHRADGPPLTPEEQQLNEAARDYIAAYNQVLSEQAGVEFSNPAPR